MLIMLMMIIIYRDDDEEVEEEDEGDEQDTFYPYQGVVKTLITRNSSHIASRIPHVNQMEQKKWLPDVVKKCMGSKLKNQFLTVQIN